MRMPLTDSIFAWYKRLRHGRGYGVHSPAAFAMVQDVLNLPSQYMYYGEADIPGRSARMLFRILVHIQPTTVAIYGETPDALVDAIVHSALPHARIVARGERADMAIVGGLSVIDTSLYNNFYFQDSRNPMVRRAIDSLPAGHVYRNPRRTLIVANPKLPRQIFDIRF